LLNLVAIFVFALAVTGCELLVPSALRPSATPSAGEEARLQAMPLKTKEELELAAAREAVKRNPLGDAEVYAFSESVQEGFQRERLHLASGDGSTLLAEAIAALDAHLAAKPAMFVNTTTHKGRLLIDSGDGAKGIVLLEAAFAKPSMIPVLGLLNYYHQLGAQNDVRRVCKKARPTVADDAERFKLLDWCHLSIEMDSTAESLSWATPADIAYFVKIATERELKIQAERDQRERDQRANAELQARFSKPDQGAPTRGSGSSAANALGTGTVSVTIRSSCAHTVRLFFGQKPKFGSGTTSSMSANSTTSHTFRAGDMLWVVDSQDNGLGSAVVATNTRELQVGSNCASLTPR
jgi:hypothetical protein